MAMTNMRPDDPLTSPPSRGIARPGWPPASLGDEITEDADGRDTEQGGAPGASADSAGDQPADAPADEAVREGAEVADEPDER